MDKLYLSLVSKGSINDLQLILETGVDPNCSDCEVYVTLFGVDKGVMLEKLSLLIKYGLNLNHPKITGYMNKILKKIKEHEHSSNIYINIILLVLCRNIYIQIHDDTLEEALKSPVSVIKQTIQHKYDTNEERKYLPGGDIYKECKSDFKECTHKKYY